MPGILRFDLARLILEVGVIRFGAFHMKLHETEPDAPPSPIYLSLRKPPAGPLTDGLIRQLGGDLLPGIAAAGQAQFQAVAGVPEAGDPFAEAFSAAAKVPQLWLEKVATAAGRRVRPLLRRQTNGEVTTGGCVLLIDDVVTQAHSKIEAAESLRSLGFVVRDVLVIVDREQGGTEALAAVGLTLHAAWRLTELLDFYRDHQLLAPDQHDEVVAYLTAQR